MTKLQTLLLLALTFATFAHADNNRPASPRKTCADRLSYCQKKCSQDNPNNDGAFISCIRRGCKRSDVCAN